jgi:hypothetical protein
MKTRVSLLLFFLFTSSLIVARGEHKNLFPRQRIDSTICLEIEGKINNSDQDGSNCKVELLLGDKVVDSVNLTGKRRKFRFQFHRNEHYTIRISKPGFVSKSVCVHTRMENAQEAVYQFYFETTLVYTKPETVEMPPVATIYFNAKKNCFYYTRSNPYVPGKANCIKA